MTEREIKGPTDVFRLSLVLAPLPLWMFAATCLLACPASREQLLEYLRDHKRTATRTQLKDGYSYSQMIQD